MKDEEISVEIIHQFVWYSNWYMFLFYRLEVAHFTTSEDTRITNRLARTRITKARAWAPQVNLSASLLLCLPACREMLVQVFVHSSCWLILGLDAEPHRLCSNRCQQEFWMSQFSILLGKGVEAVCNPRLTKPLALSLLPYIGHDNGVIDQIFSNK